MVERPVIIGLPYPIGVATTATASPSLSRNGMATEGHGRAIAPLGLHRAVTIAGRRLSDAMLNAFFTALGLSPFTQPRIR
ncbi:hypothetical protein [Sphingomonas oryzagri]